MNGTKRLLTVKQASELSGISIRTLHHYHSIGVLEPAMITDAGYRLYDEASLKRLRTILLFRELELPLSEIKALIDSPNFDERAALIRQREYLCAKAKRLDALIELTNKLIEGDDTMDFSAFDCKEMEKLSSEAKRRWGDTDAFREFENKDGARSNAERKAAADGLMRFFAEFGELMKQGEASNGESALEKVAELKAHITENYYTCTNEILSGLGEMYVLDERFKENIDKEGGDGTAEFVRAAIKAYLGQ